MADEKRLCPFQKRTIHYAGQNSGNGYPMEWESNDEFMPCIGEKCMAYTNLLGALDFCKLIEHN